MKLINILAEIAWDIKRKNPNKNEIHEVSNILNEISRYEINVINTPSGFSIVDKNNQTSFSVDLTLVKPTVYGVKFGNDGDYSWETDKLEQLKKALFLKDSIKEIIAPMFDSKKITELVFASVSSDGNEEKRKKLFKNLFEELESILGKDNIVYEETNEKYHGASSIHTI
jgi:hypothetical protein